MLNLEAHIGEVLATARDTRFLLPSNGHVPLHVLHNSKEIPINARDYLLEANVPPAIIDRYLDNQGIWAFEKQTGIDITRLTPRETMDVLEPHASPLLDMSMASLLHGHKYHIPETDEEVGLFNDHTYKNHIYFTHRMVQDLLEKAGIDDPQMRTDATAQVALHDNFNFLSRNIHNLLGARGVKRMFPNLTGGDRQRMREIQIGIMLHNEPIYREGLLQIKGLPFKDKVDHMREWHTPMSAALLIADKAEIRRGRVIPQALRPEIVNAHEHTRGNLYTDYVGTDYQDGVIDMTFAYDPWVHRNDLRYAELAECPVNAEYDQIYAPPHLKDEHGQLSMEKVYGEMWRLYGPKEKYDADRFSLMLASGFVLFPEAQTFRMNYVNKYDQHQAIELEFNRDNADEVLANIAENVSAVHP